MKILVGRDGGKGRRVDVLTEQCVQEKALFLSDSLAGFYSVCSQFSEYG